MDYSLNYLDPTPGIMKKFNELMFRGAVQVASQPKTAHLLDPDISVHQTVHVSQTLKQNVFKSDLRWYAGAAVFELLIVLLILPMF